MRSRGAVSPFIVLFALSEATAKAMQRIPDAKCNGDMHKALDYEQEAKHDLENFLTRQGVNHITGN